MKPRFFFISALLLSSLGAAVSLSADLAREAFPGAPARPLAGELYLTEIMADPTPTRGSLPEAEYLELYNGGERPVSLSGLSIAGGGSPQPLGEGILEPGRHLIVCDAEQAGAFASFGSVAGLERFPALRNDGDEVLLLGDDGDTLDRVVYAADWYEDAEKADGGWSLERRRLDAPSDCRHNWAAAVDPRGGTPGGPGSVAAPEARAPLLLRAVAESPEELRLFFDRQLDLRRASEAASYRLDGGPAVSVALPQAPAFREVLLLLNSPLRENTVYTVAVTGGLSDCLGTPAATAPPLRFGLAAPALPGDLLINEILFRPQSGGSDFVELYNHSEKILDLQDLLLINESKTGSGRVARVTTPLQLFPDEYVVFTEAPADIRQRYRVERPAALIETPLPALDAESGNLTLRRDGLTLDSLDYRDDWHSPLLEDTRGVSLERLSPQAPTREAGNWHSAAAAAGFATPTAPNSQRRGAVPAGESFFQLAGKTFSPDGDGFEDVLLIDYRADQPGYVLNLRVFDAEGRPVRTLAGNLLLGTEGVLKWDGADDQGRKARIGIYVLWFELFHPDGSVRRQREVCVLAGRL